MLSIIKLEIVYSYLYASLLSIRLHGKFSFFPSRVVDIYIYIPPSFTPSLYARKKQGEKYHQSEHGNLQLSAAFQLVFKSCIFPALKYFTFSSPKQSDTSFQVSLLTDEKRLLRKIYIFGGQSFTKLGSINQLVFS